ncbi:MAG: hypothetical protein J5612_02905 [Paludibacteraceae bacterium]|nr:hypothetical protein [Paludibacteraceae bacterium]
MFIRELLSSLVRCPVTIQTGRYSESDNTVAWRPKVRYNLLIPDMSKEAYGGLSQDLRPLFEFINQWLVPVEVHCEFEIKEYRSHPLNNALLLNYNAKLA